MGRPKLPDNVKKRRGTLQKCRAVGEQESITPANLTACYILAEEHPMLNSSEKRQRTFRLFCKQLYELGLLEENYINDLIHLAVLIDERDVALSMLMKKGPIEERLNYKGEVIGTNVSAYLIVYDKLTSEIQKLQGKYGLTPIDRQKLNAKPQELSKTDAIRSALKKK